MSDAVTVQNTSTDVSKYMYQIRKLKDSLATAAKDRDSFKAEADQYRKDNADLKSKSDHSAIRKELETLQGKLREVEFRKVFDRVAKAKGIREDALDAAYQLGQYKPNGEEIDEEALGTQIDEQKGKQTFLVAGKAEAVAVAKPEAKPAPGSGQGGKQGGSGAFQLPPDTDGRWNDPVWQWKYQKEIAQAIKEKQAQGQV